MTQRIGKYLVQRKIGQGASATVYLARDEFQESEVAVKVYDSGVLAQMQPHVRSQFLNESSLAGRLSHPHIAAILDAHADESTSYVVSEYVSGGNLHNVTSSGKLTSISDVIEIGFKCCGALDYAFRNQIVHRDIKPSNVLVAGGTDIKITDFGAAYIRNANTTQVMDIGSPSYVSPEQAEASEVTHCSDMFSLAIMLYELSTGERPFAGANPAEVVYKIVMLDPRPPSHLRPDLPVKLDDILLRAMQKRPGDRFETWADFALALAEVGRLSAFQQDIPDSERFTVLNVQPLLAELNDADIWELVRAGKWSRVPGQSLLVKEHDMGDSLFLLAAGEAKVTIGGRLLNVLSAGEWFGEMPYVFGRSGARQATVETSTDATVVEFPRDALESLGERCQLHFAKALLRNLSDRLAFSNVRVSRIGSEAG